ncbi:MAG: YIP1 family protein [Nanobdellota archaeon]
MRFIPEIKGIITKPNNFFKRVEKEKDYKKQTIFLVVVVFFIFLFLTYTYINRINEALRFLAETFGFKGIENIPLNIKTYCVFYLSFSVLYFGLALLRYTFIHWFVKLFKGKNKFDATYKAMVYTRAPEFVTAPLILIISLAFSFGFLSNNILIWIIFGVSLIIFLVLSIYQVILRTWGLAKLQEFSYFKSFIIIYILSSIAQLMVVFVLEVILITIFIAFFY